MAVDPSKLKALSRRRLGEPPGDGNPQIDGADVGASASVSAPEPLAVAVQAPALVVSTPAAGPSGRVDGRTLRKTGRTVQFATKVSPAYDQQVRDIAMERGMLLVEVLEASLAVYRRLAEAADAAGEKPEQALDRLLTHHRKK